MHLISLSEAEDLRGYWSQDTIDLIVQALRSTYDAVPTSDDIDGFDNSCFGTGIYRVARAEIEKIFSGSRDGCEVINWHNAFIYKINGIRLTCQRVSSYRQFDISDSFPRGFGAACSITQWQHGQPELFSPPHHEPPPDIPLVIAHGGNQEDGLTAAYICKPAHIEKDKILAWEWVIEIFRADGAAPARNTPVSDSPISPESIDWPSVTPRAVPALGTTNDRPHEQS